MTKVSETHADLIEELGPVFDRASTVDGHTVELVTFNEEVDMAPILAGLPGGHCSCPHWGYVIEGRVTVRYKDHDEVLEPGDVYYMAPGHRPLIEAGTKLAMISPTDLMNATDEAIRASITPAS